MVPVISEEGKALFPTKERRARSLVQKGSAKPYWQKGIYCIKLIRAESEKREEYPKVALGIDPGSKREGYTVATGKRVVLNVTTNTPNWVKEHVETRGNLRKARRGRKVRHRKCRNNRKSLKKNKLPPSTKSRWGARLRIIKALLKILPITIINVEDIKAKTRKGKNSWNSSFSPLEVGKAWFYSEVENLGLELIKTAGYTTKQHRYSRNFKKSRNKLQYSWETHNVDSHVLCEIALNKQIVPHHGIYKLEFLKFHRRQLHVQNPTKGNIRKQYGGTVSMGISRGSIVKYKEKLYYLGGSSKGMVAIHSIITGKRVKQYVKLEDIEVLCNNKWRVQFLPCLKSGVSLHNLG